MRWWAEEAEWLASRVDRWLAACQGYSKLRSSERAATTIQQHPDPSPHHDDQQQQDRRNTIRTCAQRIHSNIVRVASGRRRHPPSAQHAAKKSSSSSRTVSKSSTTCSASTCSSLSSDIVFEKCKPRCGRRTTETSSSDSSKVGDHVDDDEVDFSGVPALDIVYYPFREENCVVCRQQAAGSGAAMLTQVPCPCPGNRRGCAPYQFVMPTAQQQASSGATGALFFRTATGTSGASGVAPPPPKSAPLETKRTNRERPVINMNQDFIEVRYDQPGGDAPPSYDSAVPGARRASAASRSLARHLPPSYPADEEDDPGERTIFSRPAFLEERTIFSRPTARFRSRGKFSSVMYETQRAFQEAFQQGEDPLELPVPPRSRSLHGPPQRMGLREVDPPHSSSALHSLLSFRRRSRPGAPATPASSSVPQPHQQKQVAGGSSSRARCTERCSSRPEKRVVVGDRGIHGPVWPRVILTFDRGVSPCQARPPRPTAPPAATFPPCPPLAMRRPQFVS